MKKSIKERLEKQFKEITEDDLHENARMLID